MDRIYACIDLKSFYASVECAERNLDPLKTNLVVADSTRGKGSICLAITPKMKSLGVKNRCRLYEIPSDIKYIIAKPRMKLYMKYSAKVYHTYLKYLSPEDIHVYSIDECFFDFTSYLKLYNLSPKALAKKMIDDVFYTTKIQATAGIGTNLFLSKVALDIIAKHTSDGIGFLDEELFKENLWHHKPLTDFWNIGTGIKNRLERLALYDLYDVAHCDEKLLYKEFGINAELIVDHAWGKESCSIEDIKKYKSKNKSISNSQVLFEDYNFNDALIVLREMVESSVLEIVKKKLLSNTIGLKISYSKDVIPSTGGRRILSCYSNNFSFFEKAFTKLYFETTLKDVPIRKIGISFSNLTSEQQVQLTMFNNQIDSRIEKAVVDIQDRYGKNSIILGISLKDKATTRKRNNLIGGHNAD